DVRGERRRCGPSGRVPTLRPPNVGSHGTKDPTSARTWTLRIYFPYIVKNSLRPSRSDRRAGPRAAPGHRAPGLLPDPAPLARMGNRRATRPIRCHDGNDRSAQTRGAPCRAESADLALVGRIPGSQPAARVLTTSSRRYAHQAG